MSDGSLSQEEIDALLKGGSSQENADAAAAAAQSNAEDRLSDDETDTIGEVANICMGTAATALFSLVNKKVEISTPEVHYSTWDELTSEYEKPCVLIHITYTKGLNGSNVLVLREPDVKVITDLMMGGDGTKTDGEITELHLSAISEAMNQMMGSSATSLSSMLNRTIDISPPKSTLVDLGAGDTSVEEVDSFLTGTFIEVDFKLKIGDLVDSKMIQLYPIPLAREMVESVKNNMENDTNSTVDDSAPAAAPKPAPSVSQVPPEQMQMGSLETAAQEQRRANQPEVNVQPAQFSTFSGTYDNSSQAENIDLIKDVPLEVTVELGRTHKSIQDILDFAPGTIIELNKIAGEPIDVLVNGKYVAKGEVVVIEESFGIRITEILKQ